MFLLTFRMFFSNSISRDFRPCQDLVFLFHSEMLVCRVEMVAQIIFATDRERTDLAVENRCFVSHVQVPLQIFLVEIAFLAEMTEVIAVSFVKLHVVFELGVVNEGLLASVELALEPRLLVVHSVPC